jgi:tetratricopeptide (TPR) repeat protein
MRVLSCLLLLVAPAFAADPTATHEDVEVMRRLISSSITTAANSSHWGNDTQSGWHKYNLNSYSDQTYPSFHNYPASPPITLWSGFVRADGQVSRFQSPRVQDVREFYFTANNAAQNPLLHIDGNYLKGVGAIYALEVHESALGQMQLPKKSNTLASNCSKCHQNAMNAKIAVVDKPKPKVVDEWDSTLADIKGVKPEMAAQPVSDWLQRDEICWQGNIAELLMGNLAKFGHRFREMAPDEKFAIAVTIRRMERTPVAKEPVKKSAAQEMIELAEMHAKRGKTDEAVKAYQQAIQAYSETLNFPADTTPEEAQAKLDQRIKSLKYARSQLAQYYMSLNRIDEATEELQKAKSADVKVGPMPKAAAALPQLPTKISVVVSRKMIDDYKAGKMTIDQLREKIDVSTFGSIGEPKKK